MKPPKVYGIIGYPVGHSPSPAMHNAAFQALGLEACYTAWPISPEELPAFVQAARLLKFGGVSVTLPHKAAIIPLLDGLSPQAEAAGAVNTLYFDQGALLGHNTDVEGFLTPLLQSQSSFERALILGAGGVARAAIAALRVYPGLKRLGICARRPEQAQELIQTVSPAILAPGLGRDTALDVELVPWDERENWAADLLVNATSLGLPGSAQAEAMPSTVFSGQGLAYDLISFQTPWLQKAQEAGWKTLNGQIMLFAQGQAQFLLWTGQPMPPQGGEALFEFFKAR